ncbi:MAG: hypothetical protein MUC39_05825 [Candidatus Omnitrophica bacterium]|jgi:hypothetical protein|nr:hypothetical protein [Candidatus Omnitrophota bacterium]
MKLKLFFLLLTLTCVCIGCAGTQKQPPINESVLEPQAMLKFSDVPVPMGFKMLLRESYSFQSGGVRVGLLKYQGKGNIDQVINFYRDQMPMYNWNLLNIIEFNERLLNFDRENETCIVSLLPKGNTIILTISVGPKAQNSKKGNRAVK